MGVTRGWRSALWGVGAGRGGAGGDHRGRRLRARPVVPRSPRCSSVVGVLLLIFGLQWLRKAILRSAGLKALHDEDEVVRRGAGGGRAAAPARAVRARLVRRSSCPFKGVFLEGLEVVFIVITFGLNAGSTSRWPRRPRRGGGDRARRRRGRAPAARAGAREHAQVLVGLLLSTFGTFWVVEGLGVFAPDGKSLEWPGGGWALPVLLVLWMVTSWATVRVLQRVAKRNSGSPNTLRWAHSTTSYSIISNNNPGSACCLQHGDRGCLVVHAESNLVVPRFVNGVPIPREIEFHRRHEAYDFFLAQAGAPSDAVGRVVRGAPGSDPCARREFRWLAVRAGLCRR